MIKLILFLIAGVLPASAQWPATNWSWIAPEPPLPDTQWLDYGWDSTSNGPPVTGLAARQERAPLRLANHAAPDAQPTQANAPTAAKDASASLVNGISVSPYYTVGFRDFNGDATSGAGLDIGLNLSKTVQLVSFAESDDVNGSLVDRFGLGVQLTGKLGRWLKPFARLSGGYNFEGSSGLRSDRLFLRPQFGAILDVWKHKAWHASLTGSWALDVDTEGNAAQRLFGGFVLGTSF